ncbi:hypothetical protein QQ045_007238 [Rhodiola kirilowii]
MFFLEITSDDTEEEAAEAYDIASLKFRGPASINNFDISRYDLHQIANNPIPFSAEPRPIGVSGLFNRRREVRVMGQQQLRHQLNSFSSTIFLELSTAML